MINEEDLGHFALGRLRSTEMLMIQLPTTLSSSSSNAALTTLKNCDYQMNDKQFLVCK